MKTPYASLCRVAAGLLLVLVAAAGCRRPPPPPATPTMVLELRSEPSGAEVMIDGHAKTITTPCKIQVKLDEHFLQFRFAGYERTWVKVPRRVDAKPIAVTLRPLTAALFLESTPSGASVTLDGAEVGVTPLFLPEVRIGAHKAQLGMSGYEPKDYLFRIEDPRPRRASIDLDSLMANVEVSSTPPGAAIYLDGFLRGNTPLDGKRGLKISDVKEGDHELVAKLANYEDLRYTFHLQRKEVKGIVLPALKELPGGLEIATLPSGANVYINGDLAGKSPVRLRDLKSGSLALRIEMPNYEPTAQDIVVSPGLTKRLEITLVSSVGGFSLRTQPPGCGIWVNGNRLDRQTVRSGPTSLISDPFDYTGLAAGTHVVRIEHPQYEAQQRNILVQKGQNTDMGLIALKEKWLPTHTLVLKNGRQLPGRLHLKNKDGSVEFWLSPQLKATYTAEEVQEVKEL